MSGTPVADLSPLKGLKLTELRTCGAKVTDLSPLKGMPLHSLSFDETLVTDLSPLKGLSLGIRQLYGTANLDPSSWGEPMNGLRCRVYAPPSVAHGEPVHVRIQLQTMPEQLQPGVVSISKYSLRWNPALYLKSRSTGETTRMGIIQGRMPGGRQDKGERALLKAGTLGLFGRTFYLVTVQEDVVPGQYECWLEFSSPKEMHDRWREEDAEWKKAGFWYGQIRSGTLPLEVVQKEPELRSFLVPKRLVVEYDKRDKRLRVVFRSADAEEVKLPVRPGHGVRTRIKDPSGDSYGPYEGPGAIDHWYHYLGGSVDKSYTYILYEYEVSPRRSFREPGYRELWKKTFRISLSEEEIRKLLPTPKLQE